VVGINTAIATRTGGYQGVGFAIPVNMARKIMDSLISKGHVVRGWLGVSIQNVSEDMAEVLGLDRAHGALVGQVVPDGPADKAGIRQGDLIVELDGKEIQDVEQLQLMVVDRDPGSRVAVTVVRERSRRSIEVRLGELPEDGELAGGPGDRGEGSREGHSTDLGMSLTNLTSGLRRELDLPSEVDGVVVTGVDPAKAAGRAGLQRGDVILRAGDTEVHGVRAFERALEEAPSGEPVLLLVRRGEAEIFVAVRVPE
jgi:serine protease Do